MHCRPARHLFSRAQSSRRANNPFHSEPLVIFARLLLWRFSPDPKLVIFARRYLAFFTRPEHHRHDANNPNRRWAYEEVNAWLRHEDLPVPGTINAGQDNSRSIPPFRFCERTYDNIDELCFAMAKNWEDGKRQVQRMTLRDHLRSKIGASDNQLLWASIIDDIANNTKYSTDERLIRILYNISPSTNYIYCPLGVFSSTKDYGGMLLDMLSSDYADVIETAIASTTALLQSGAFAHFVTNNSGQTASIDLVNHFEELVTQKNWDLHCHSYLFEFAYRLTQRTDLDVFIPNKTPNKIIVHSVDELKACLTETCESNLQSLYSICALFFDDDGKVKPKVYGWMKIMGCDIDNL